MRGQLQVKSGGQIVARHLALALEKVRLPRSRQNHEGQELQRSQEFAAGRKLSFAPGFVQFALGRLFGVLPLSGMLGFSNRSRAFRT